MPELKDAVVVVGVPGLNGTGLTSGEKTALTNDTTGLKAATVITQTPSATHSAEQALSTLPTGLLKVTTTTGVLSTAAAADLPTHTHTTTSALVFVLYEGGAVLTTGVKPYADLPVPFACTITGWRLYTSPENTTGSITLDVWRDIHNNYTPTVADTIIAAGSIKPNVVNTYRALLNTPSGWTTAVSADDIFRVNVDSITAVTRATLVLRVTKTG
ncbi:MAG: hypothetical protein M3440_02140 [Chloroflexota bacterium]|nr:hypothetical protein [Chloroflexota bacterium]